MPRIIAENEWLFAIDKPAGLIVHSDGRTEEASLAQWLIERHPYLEDIGAWISPQGVSYPVAGIVHRLDRTTSGVVLAAKTHEAYDYLKKEFKERRIKKSYRAYVYGTLPQKGRIVAEIMRSSAAPKRWYARPCDEDDIRAAITEWNVLGTRTDVSGEVASYLEVMPLTGRTHQLRVHFSSIGHPIVSDHLYASDRKPLFGFTRPALHAYSISLTLPDGTRADYSEPLPEDFDPGSSSGTASTSASR